MYGYIYKTTNLINSKIYVGQKKSDRFLAEKYLGSGIKFKSALKHYGSECFKVEMIDTAESRDELNAKEIYWIDFFNSCDECVGYNISIGGSTPAGIAPWNKGMRGARHHSEETKRKMSESHLGHSTSQSTKNKISQSNTGKKRTLEQREANRKRNQNKVWVRKDGVGTTIQSEYLEEYLNLGWERGRPQYNKNAWNKGLTKETDERVARYAEKRQACFESGESIGCFGVKGNTNGFKKGNVPWNKGLKHYNDGHPNYYHGKKNK